MYDKPKAKVVLDVKSKEVRRLLKVRITYNRVSRYYNTTCKTLLTDGEFENDNLKKTKTAKSEADACRIIAEHIIDDLGTSFSFEEFRYQYKEKAFNKKGIRPKTGKGIEAAYDEYFLDNNNLSISTIESYNSGKKWLLSYKPDCTINDITKEFLVRFESYIRAEYKKRSKQKAKRAKQSIPVREISQNTLNIYFRGLRAVYNHYIEKHKIIREYPFNKNSLQSVGRQKKSLTTEELRIIIVYESNDKGRMFSRDFFILSFLLGGANLGDIFSFTNANITETKLSYHLSFRRQKTKKTDVIIEMDMPDEAIEIIKKYGRLVRTKPNEYVFPFYAGLDDENKIRERKKNIIKKINKGLAEICEEKGIGKITTYNARHTYATLLQGKIDKAVIQKMLGHASIRTTEIYLGSLTTGEQGKTKEALEQIMKEAREGGGQ